jgi:transcriptional regulator with XRE-family HTH domain
MDTFGQRLQRLRDRKGLTLEGLAIAIGSTKSYIWELENKPNIRPSAELVYKLSKALDTTVGVLLGESEPEHLSEADQVFFRNYQELKPETKKRLSRIMDVLMDEDEGEQQ